MSLQKSPWMNPSHDIMTGKPSTHQGQSAKNHQFVNSHFTQWKLNHRITSFIPCFMQSKGSKQLLVSQLLTLGIPAQSFHQPLYFDTVLSINTLHQSLMHKKIAPLITKHEVPTQKWVWWVLMSLMCSCSSTACPLTGLEGQVFGMRIVVEEEEELVEVVALQLTPQAYSLTPVVEQSEVATSRTWNRKGNINIRITFNLMHNNHQLLKNLALYVIPANFFWDISVRFLSWECWNFWRRHHHFRRFPKKSEVFWRRPKSTEGEVIEKTLIHKDRR